jgi:hypothetical protein
MVAVRSTLVGISQASLLSCTALHSVPVAPTPAAELPGRYTVNASIAGACLGSLLLIVAWFAVNLHSTRAARRSW